MYPLRVDSDTRDTCLQITDKNIYLLTFQFLQEGARIQAQLTLSLTTLAKTKEKYDKAFGASEKAMEAYNKADADLNLSRADVEKQRMNSNIKRQQMDDSKNEYANQLQKTNELQVRVRGRGGDKYQDSDLSTNCIITPSLL